MLGNLSVKGYMNCEMLSYANICECLFVCTDNSSHSNLRAYHSVVCYADTFHSQFYSCIIGYDRSGGVKNKVTKKLVYTKFAGEIGNDPYITCFNFGQNWYRPMSPKLSKLFCTKPRENNSSESHEICWKDG